MKHMYAIYLREPSSEFEADAFYVVARDYGDAEEIALDVMKQEGRFATMRIDSIKQLGKVYERQEDAD